MARVRWWQKKRLDLFETTLIVLAVAFVVWKSDDAARRTHHTHEGHWLESAYQGQRHSEHYEEWIVRDFFQDQPNGVFVDVGANHYKTFSNTYYLEEHLGWSGLAVEPLEQFREEYRQYRPRTVFHGAYVSDRSDERATLYFLPSQPLVTSSRKEFTERWGKGVTQLDVPTVTLNDLLDRERISTFDFLSMDIELAEPKALAGFDIERFRPRLVCVEGHPEVRQQILEYFNRHDYILVGKYLRADTHNLWFVPAPRPTPRPAPPEP